MSSSSEELKQLLDLAFDQQCDDEQAERLRQLLADQPERVDDYIEQSRLHSLLQWHCESPDVALPNGDVSGESPLTVSRPQARWSRGFVVRLAAVASLLLLVAFGLNKFRDASGPDEPVGWVSDASGVVWPKSQQAYEVGVSFAPGEIRTIDGRLVLQFASGATLTCDGAGTLHVLSDMHVKIAAGKIRVRVADSAKGFVVETPDAEVIDLGTEFGVIVEDGIHTDVVVFDGEVDLQRKTNNKEEPQRLTKGEAVRVDVGGDVQRIVQVNRESDSWSVGETDSPESVIRSISDSLRDADGTKFYEIVPGGFCEDALAYVDRMHQWNGLTDDGLPPFLLDGDYIRTFNHDKSESQLEIRLGIAGPAMLYVLYDNRCEIPSWLSDSFTDTNVDVGRDLLIRRSALQTGIGPGESIDDVASIWRLRVEEARDVLLGAVVRGPRGAGSMYGIVAVRIEQESGLPEARQQEN